MGLPHEKYLCLAIFCILMSIPVIAINFVVILSIHRLRAICDPIKFSIYKNNCPKLEIGFCVLSGILFGFLPLFGWRCNQWEGSRCSFLEVMDDKFIFVFYLIEFVLPVLLLSSAYGTICYLLHQSSRNSKFVNERIIEVTKNVYIVVGVFLLCWVPLGIINVYNYFCEYCFNNFDIINFAIVFSHSSAAINPMIYAYRIREIRNALKSLVNDLKFC